eukprot:COSAG06_NODE_68059_length_241_cov_24.760563_1_plen_72_part_01
MLFAARALQARRGGVLRLPLLLLAGAWRGGVLRLPLLLLVGGLLLLVLVRCSPLLPRCLPFRVAAWCPASPA